MQPMYAFRGAVEKTGLNDWWDNGGNQIAFGRGDKGFIAINKDGYQMSGTFQTGLPSGDYVDIFSGKSVSVDGSRKVTFSLSNQEDNNIFGIIVGGSNGGDTPSPTNSPVDGSCDVGQKTDCGFLGIDKVGCEEKSCCWVPDYQGSDPWCYFSENSIFEEKSVPEPSLLETSVSENMILEESYDSEGYGSGDTEKCEVKSECGWYGINIFECEAQGCCWVPDYEGKDPWCFNSGSNGSCELIGKHDCGFIGIDEFGCEAKGCCWVPDYEGDDPWCFHSNDRSAVDQISQLFVEDFDNF